RKFSNSACLLSSLSCRSAISVCNWSRSALTAANSSAALGRGASSTGESETSCAFVSGFSVLTIFRLSKAGFSLAARDRALSHIAEFAPDVQHRSHDLFVLHAHRTEHSNFSREPAGKRQGYPDQR